MVTYEQWNKAIISYFFEDCEPGQIVFLQTNAETLDEIAERSDFNISDAADSLKMAVRDKVVVRGAVNFSVMNPTLWKDYSQEKPPQVAFLALTVFAASLMESEGSVASHNYYSRLNEVLFGQVIKGTPQGFNRDEFENFWKHLRRWAFDQHNVVLYLTEGSSSRRYVWYPISQCLISKRDRRIIYRFFRDRELTPFSRISDNQLEKDLSAWLRQSAGSTRIERYFSNESYKKSILSQVELLLVHWDGEVPPEPLHGQRQTTSLIHVGLRFDQFDNVEVHYWFQRRGRDEIDCRTNPLGIKRLQTFNSEKWFRPVTDNRSTFWNLSNRLQLQTDEIRSIIYFLNRSSIWVFRVDAECDNDWISQRNMHLYEDHLILCRKRLASQVIDCLRQTCEEEIEELSPIYVDGKGNDWLYLRVKPTKHVSFFAQEFWRLSVDSSEQIKFVGGLSVRGRDGHKAYLDICLPTVLIPSLGFSNQETLQIDEQPFLVGEDRLVTLCSTLKPGVYRLTYGKQAKVLEVVSPNRSLEHQIETLIATIPEDQAAMQTYTVREISEISKEFGLWFTGAKFFGIDIPRVTWGDMHKIPELSKKHSSQSFKVPANIISSVVKMAIDFKQRKTSVPEWFDEAIEYLDQNVALRAHVEKKLNRYRETALSYVELRKRAGK